MSNSSPNFNVDTPDAADTSTPYAFNSKVMLGAVILLFLVIAFILLLHVYARWFLRRSSQSYVITRGPASSVRHHNGLDKAAIAQLPTFVYTATCPAAENSAAGKAEESSVAMPAPECAVCLSEFQENEKGRLLPACKHIFHTECIDMWFSSHTTCPLCRTNVSPAMATLTETTATDQQPEAMESPQGTTDGNSATLRVVEYPCNVLFWGNQTQLGASSQEPSSSSLPASRPSLRTAGARALPEITIHIPPIEGTLLVSTSECRSAKCSTDQEAGSSHLRKSPGFGASIKRMLSRQSSRQRSPSSKGNEQSPK